MDCAYTIWTNVIAMIHLPATGSIIIAKQASVSLEIVLTKIALRFLTPHGSRVKVMMTNAKEDSKTVIYRTEKPPRMTWRQMRTVKRKI
jgi:hypothetical protein